MSKFYKILQNFKILHVKILHVKFYMSKILHVILHAKKLRLHFKYSKNKNFWSSESSMLVYVLGMTLNSFVVVPSMTLNSSGASKEWYSVSKLQFALPQFIFFVWLYPTCCVASLRAVPVGCISYKSVYCVTFGHL